MIRYLQSAGGLRKAVWQSAEKRLIKDKILKGGTYMGVVESIKEEGRLEGEIRGEKRGEKRGIQKGIQRGIQQIIANMLKEKADLSFISKVTGLPEKEIKKLKNGS